MTLGRRWRSLFVLAVLSVATVIVLALLFRHARRDAEKHRQAEEGLRDSEQRLESVLAAIPDLIRALGGDDSENVRAQSAALLGVSGSDLGVDPLIRALKEDFSEAVRVSALAALLTLKPARWFAPLTSPLW